MFETFEAMALSDLGKLDDDGPDEDTLVSDGFWFPWHIVLETFEAWRNHGVLPHSGGWLDQSPQWRNDMRKCNRIYNYFIEQNRDRDDGETAVS